MSRLDCFSLRIANVPDDTNVTDLIGTSKEQTHYCSARQKESDTLRTFVVTIEGDRETLRTSIDVKREAWAKNGVARRFHCSYDFAGMTPLNEVSRTPDTVE